MPGATMTSISTWPRPSMCPLTTCGASTPRRVSTLCSRTIPMARARLDAPRAPARHRGSRSGGTFRRLFARQDGYRPLILERGRAVKDRVADVRRFDENGPLDPESNYLFGEGGPGHSATVSSPRAAPAQTSPVSWKSSPTATASHRSSTNTGRISGLTACRWSSGRCSRKFEELGGEIRFSCRVEDLDIADGRLRGLSTSSGYIAAELAILAIGHSARDTYGMFLERGVPMEAKPFQLGVRIEQPQAAIDQARYGPIAGHPALGAADYSASVRAGSRDLFTFCMCAGGYVMPSVSDPGYFCTNGMSESRHDSPFANSGLVVTIEPDETGSLHPLAGIHYQQRVERLAFEAGDGSYKAPIQWARDFLAGRPSRGKLPSSYRRGTVPFDLAPLLPEPVIESLMIGLPLMDRRFGRRFLRDATLTGPESRGSSPVRIVRDPQTGKARRSLGFTRAAKEPAMPAES